MVRTRASKKGLKRARRIAHLQASIYATYVTAHVEYLESRSIRETSKDCAQNYVKCNPVRALRTAVLGLSLNAL